MSDASVKKVCQPRNSELMVGVGVQRESLRGWVYDSAIDKLISQMVSINWFHKVNSP